MADSSSTDLGTSVFSYRNLVHAVSGSVGSTVSMLVFYPLETARTRLQVDDKRKANNTVKVIQDIIQEEGLQAVYQGLLPVVTTLCCSNFVYFYTFNGLKAYFLGKDTKPTPLSDIGFAFVAGVINVLTTNPLWVANMRLKLQGVKFKTPEYRDEDKNKKYRGTLDALNRIAKEEGLLALWAGTVSSLVLATNPALHFMVYEAIKRFFLARFKQQELSALAYFLAGAAAKLVATVITYPLQILQSRQRSGYNDSEAKQNLLQGFKELVRRQGWKGLYKGMEAKLLQTVLNAALMFMAYEKIAAFIFRLMGASA